MTEEDYNFEPTSSTSKEEDNRRKSLQLDSDSEEETEEEIKKSIRQSCITPKEEFKGEGFLLKKPPSGNSWDSRYFRIKNGILYWYLNERSRTCQNKLKIEEIEECLPDPSSDSKFIVVTANLRKGKDKKKTYKFDAATSEMQELWVEAITKEMKSCDESQLEEDPQLSISSGKEPLLKDFETIKRRQQKLNSKAIRTRSEIRQERRSLNKTPTSKETPKYEPTPVPTDGVQGGCCGFFSFFK